MKIKLLLNVALTALLSTFLLTSCQKEDVKDPMKPYLGLWVVEKDTYKENSGNVETTYYDEPDLYYINIRANGSWTEEETYLGGEPIVRTYQYEIIGIDSILCYTRVPEDGHKLKFEIDGLSMRLFENGFKEVQGQSIPYSYVRYLYK